MSILWIIRLSLIGCAYILIAIFAYFLKNRQKYQILLENTVINTISVILFNGFCYISVLLPPDNNIIQKPSFLYHPLNIRWFDIVGLIFMVLGVIILLSSILKRRSIGAQDTDGRLLTTGIYSFCRHPIYFGIIIISLGFSLRSINIDSLLIFPLILLLNYIQAKIEEIYDVGIRFKEEYSKYKKQVRIFGPIWLWCTLIIILVFPLVVTMLI